MNEVPDPLLREGLRASMPDIPDGCLDAETLARFADDELSRDGRASVEAHAARGARCQAMLAAMERTAPPAIPRPWYRMARFGWMAPVTAVAVLAVWVTALTVKRQQIQLPSVAPPSPHETSAASASQATVPPDGGAA